MNIRDAATLFASLLSALSVGCSIGPSVGDDVAGVDVPHPDQDVVGDSGGIRDAVAIVDTGFDDVATGRTAFQLACMTCRTDDECGLGGHCLAFDNGRHCVNECVDDGDCRKGFVCHSWSDLNACLPQTLYCVGCAFDEPCEEGLCCDFNSGACKDCGTECSCCQYDFDCAQGYRCLKTNGASAGVCMPECVDGACDENFGCVQDGGVGICRPLTDGCPGCAAETPWLLDCECVQCRDSADCLDYEICLELNHTCLIADCVNEDEILCESDWGCHQCCDDSDCLPFAESTGKCLEDGTCEGVPPCDGKCTDDFPVCAVVQGIEQCVQCVEDADCAVIDPECVCVGDPLFSCMRWPTGQICQIAGGT